MHVGHVSGIALRGTTRILASTTTIVTTNGMNRFELRTTRLCFESIVFCIWFVRFMCTFTKFPMLFHVSAFNPTLWTVLSPPFLNYDFSLAIPLGGSRFQTLRIKILCVSLLCDAWVLEITSLKYSQSKSNDKFRCWSDHLRMDVKPIYQSARCIWRRMTTYLGFVLMHLYRFIRYQPISFTWTWMKIDEPMVIFLFFSQA